MHVQIDSLVQVLILITEKTHPIVGWKTMNSSNNAHKPDSTEWSETRIYGICRGLSGQHK